MATIALCGAGAPGGLLFCTRPTGHPGRHIATIGPYAEDEYRLAEWLPAGELRVEPVVDDAITRALAAEMAILPPMEFVFRPASAFALAGLIQLALRHPAVAGGTGTREIARMFLEAVREYFLECPTVLDVLRRGDDPAEDVTT